MTEKKIKTYIIFPARLKIFGTDGKSEMFGNPRAAADGLLEFVINMEILVEEPDSESAL